MTVLVISLAVVMVVEGVIAGLWYPGFFTGGGSVNMEQLLEETMQEENEDVDLMNYPMPGKVGDIVNTYTDEEMNNAPKTEIPVSPENPKASAGKFSVDFGEWNLDQEDTLIVRELPEHYDSTTGYIINGYDFSLASGQSEFLTEVVVTVPRESPDEYDSMFVTKNKETGKYEYSYFEISEDGANYLIYTTHFSEQDRITHKGFAEGITKDIEDGKIDNSVTRDSLCAFYYPNYVAPNKRMTARGWDPSTAALLSVTNPNDYEQIKEDYINNFAAELAAKHAPIILVNILTHVHLAQLEGTKVVEETLLPRLNTMVEFKVVDKSLPDPTEFAQSVYNAPLRKQEGMSADSLTYYGLPDFSKCVEAPMYFTIKDDSGKTSYVGKPVFLPRQRYGINTRVVSYKEYYPAHPNFLPHFSGTSGNVVFRCTYFHYLMMGSPTAMTFHDTSGKGKNDKTVDFELSEPEADGVIRVTIEAPAVKQANSDELKVVEDGTMNYGIIKEIKEFSENPMPANNTVSIGDDGKSVKIDLPAVNHSFHSITDKEDLYIDYTYTHTRSAMQLTGRITETHYDGSGRVSSRVGVILTGPETISGMGLDHSTRNNHDDDNVEMYTRTDVNINQLVFGTDITEGQPPDSVSYFNLLYDEEEKLQKVTIYLSGNCKRTLSNNTAPEGYTTTDKRRSIVLETVD